MRQIRSRHILCSGPDFSTALLIQLTTFSQVEPIGTTFYTLLMVWVCFFGDMIVMCQWEAKRSGHALCCSFVGQVVYSFVCFGVWVYSGSFQTVINLQSRCKVRMAGPMLHLSRFPFDNICASVYMCIYQKIEEFSSLYLDLMPLSMSFYLNDFLVEGRLPKLCC